MAVYHVKPYRRGWLKHLLHLQLRTAFCALFGLVRWRCHTPPSRLYDNFGVTITLAEIVPNRREWWEYPARQDEE